MIVTNTKRGKYVRVTFEEYFEKSNELLDGDYDQIVVEDEEDGSIRFFMSANGPMSRIKE